MSDKNLYYKMKYIYKYIVNIKTNNNNIIKRTLIALLNKILLLSQAVVLEMLFQITIRSFPPLILFTLQFIFTSLFLSLS